MSARVIEWERGCPSVGAVVAALGVFDGVHLGHQHLNRAAVEIGRAEGVPVAAVTFDRDPDRVVTPDAAAPQLLELDEKVRYLSETGVDVVVILPFCTKMAQTPPDRFVADILAEAVEPRVLVVGEDFRFGAHASGGVERLSQLGQVHEFRVVSHELVSVDGAPVTSTRIRALIAEGEVASAATLLGRAHRMPGRVVHGRGEGSAIAVPTANIVPSSIAAVPADGVYAGEAYLGTEPVPAAISVGPPPSFEAPGKHTVEAHLIGFEGDLYHTEVTLGFTDRLRDLQRFDDAESLKAQIEADIERVREGSHG